MTALLGGLTLILFAGVSSVALGARPELGDRIYRFLFGAGCTLAAVPPIRVLAGTEVRELRLEAAMPGGAWVFGVDALSALFLLIVVSVGAATAFYGATYLRTHSERARAGFANLLLALLVVALALVVSARAAMPFLLAWETMAIAAYLLVVFEDGRAEIRRAGLLYLVASHTATLALFVLFAVWGTAASDLTFTALAVSRPLAPAAEAAVLLLALFGFGLKAGLVPFHFWLPEAHAAAPSHVSALMSGVVIKMGIYGLLRVVALMGSPAAWWGWLLLGSGVLSGVLGVLWALGQHDLKRLLAFHSVENIGIILLGLGAGVLGLAYQRPEVAALGFAGALLHTLNHALFKSLLFLGAGSVYHSTGTREIDRLGGLAHWMPQTAAAFLLGSIAIVGLPPLNGFVSEWLVFRSLLHAGFSANALRIAILAAASLGLMGALALACFAKVVGVMYLGRPRYDLDSTVHESPPGMLRPQFALAAACLAIGLLPALALPPIRRAAAVVAHQPDLALRTDAAAGGLTVFTLIVGASLFAAWVLRVRMTRLKLATAETWACGYGATTPRMQYTASSFAAPLLVAYDPVASIHTRRTHDALATHAVDPILDLLLLPGWARLRFLATRMRPLQRGRLSLYLGYIVFALVTLLLYLLVEARTP